MGEEVEGRAFFKKDNVLHSCHSVPVHENPGMVRIDTLARWKSFSTASLHTVHGKLPKTRRKRISAARNRDSVNGYVIPSESYESKNLYGIKTLRLVRLAGGDNTTCFLQNTLILHIARLQGAFLIHIGGSHVTVFRKPLEKQGLRFGRLWINTPGTTVATVLSRKELPMKIVVTSQGRELNSPVDPRFGRAKYFIAVDTDSGDFSASDNSQNLNAAQGAGIQAGKKVADLGAQAVITGHVGPKAFATLQTGSVSVYTGVSGTVAEAVEQFKSGALKESGQADVEAGWV